MAVGEDQRDWWKVAAEIRVPVNVDRLLVMRTDQRDFHPTLLWHCLLQVPDH